LEDALTGVPIDVVPVNVGEGRKVVSAPRKEGMPESGSTMPTRRGRETDAVVPTGFRTGRFTATDPRGSISGLLFAGTELSDSVFCFLFGATELSESVSCFLITYAPWGQADVVM